jgi:hypothetical protein
MRKLLAATFAGFLLGGVFAAVPQAQTLSAQVLQLLTRVNAWTATNTFIDLRLIQGIPSTTTNRFYEDNSGNLYFNGNLVAGAGGGGTLHNLLSTTHPDTLPSSVARGGVIVGNSTPAWAQVALCPSGDYLGSNGTDTLCLSSAAGFTAIPGAQITGTLAAVSGVNLTNLNASALASGTVPLAQLSGITTSQLSGSAAITRAQLSIAAGITLTTDVTGVLPLANGGTNLSAAADDTTLVSSGTAWVATAIPNCVSATTALAYTTATNLFSCQTLSVGSGTVTSVAMTVPTGFAISGSAITTSGTLGLTLSTELANLVWAGPSSGGATTPTFRALVNADLPATAVTPGTYPVVTVNQQGVITAGTSTVNLATYGTGTLAYTHGGTGVAVAGNNTLLVGNGSAWVATTVTDCQGGTLGFTQSSNLFSCVASVAATAAGSGTLGTTALPFSALVVGTAATNNLSITPAAFSQATVATVADPKLAAVNLAIVSRGTLTYTSGALTTGTCSAAVTATVTGLLTTSVVHASLATTPAASWQTGVFIVAYPTANTVNAMVCNPTAGTITPATATINYAALVP